VTFPLVLDVLLSDLIGRRVLEGSTENEDNLVPVAA
jgi:hypothetical protein